jgi:hypothetical protein
MAGLSPAISMGKAAPCQTKRDGRDKPGLDNEMLLSNKKPAPDAGAGAIVTGRCSLAYFIST